MNYISFLGNLTELGIRNVLINLNVHHECKKKNPTTKNSIPYKRQEFKNVRQKNIERK